VTELGAVLTGDTSGRQHFDDVTLFDSTAIQDLAIAKAAHAKADELDLRTLELRCDG
jgi:ornithine cyclodeaminase/alanine dehydrogenase-like protein (mu-crystallin family)